MARLRGFTGLSRFGMAATELEELLADDAAGVLWPKTAKAPPPPFSSSAFYALVLGFGRFLSNADGLLNIRGIGMQHAVRAKYLTKGAGGGSKGGDQAKRTCSVMIGYFMRKLKTSAAAPAGGKAGGTADQPTGGSKALGLRRVCDELPQLLVDANERQHLQTLLLDLRVFEALWTRRQADLFAYWHFCGAVPQDGKVPPDTGQLYLEAIKESDSETPEVCQMLGDFLSSCALFSDSRAMFERAYHLVHDGIGNDEKSEAVAAAHVRLAHAYHLEGTDLAKATHHMRAGIGIHDYRTRARSRSSRSSRRSGSSGKGPNTSSPPIERQNCSLSLRPPPALPRDTHPMRFRVQHILLSLRAPLAPSPPCPLCPLAPMRWQC